MKFTTTKNDILKGLENAVKITPAKTSASYLRVVWLQARVDGLRVMSTDSNMDFYADCAATVDKPGLAGVYGRDFLPLVKNLDKGNVLIETETRDETEYLILKQGNVKYKLPTANTSWFAEFDKTPDTTPILFSTSDLQALFHKILFCVGDENHEAIGCANFHAIPESNLVHVCSLNGHQFALQRLEHPAFWDALKARKPEEYNGDKKHHELLLKGVHLEKLKKLIPKKNGVKMINLYLGEKRAFFQVGGGETLSVPIKSGFIYPDYSSFLSRQDAAKAHLTINRETLINGLKKVQPFNTNENRSTYFSFKNGKVALTNGPNHGESQITLELDGKFKGEIWKPADYEKAARPAKQIVFPTSAMIELLARFDAEDVQLDITDNEGPCFVTGTDPEYLIIIMPMKIVEDSWEEEEPETKSEAVA